LGGEEPQTKKITRQEKNTHLFRGTTLKRAEYEERNIKGGVWKFLEAGGRGKSFYKSPFTSSVLRKEEKKSRKVARPEKKKVAQAKD